MTETDHCDNHLKSLIVRKRIICNDTEGQKRRKLSQFSENDTKSVFGDVMPNLIEKWMVLFLLPNNDDCEEIYKTSLDILQDTIDSIEIFTKFNRCADFIKTINNTTIHLIVSK